MREVLYVAFVVVVAIACGLLVAAAALALRRSARPPRHTAAEMPLPDDPHAEDWAAWEFEMQTEEA